MLRYIALFLLFFSVSCESNDEARILERDLYFTDLYNRNGCKLHAFDDRNDIFYSLSEESIKKVKIKLEREYLDVLLYPKILTVSFKLTGKKGLIECANNENVPASEIEIIHF